MTTQLPQLNVAGMVTLYNSEQTVIQRLSTYVYQVGKLYAVDNSEYPNFELIELIRNTYPTIEYICNEGNPGIAHALNVAARAATLDQFSYLLMMDDDSEAPSDLVNALYAVLIRKLSNKVGIVSAQSDPSVNRDDEQQVITAITSGSLLDLRAYQLVGPFQDDLFIDWVDHEYCFRLAKNGYKIVIVNYVKLIHRLGTFKSKQLLGFLTVRWRSHNPSRLYYKFRNSLYVMNKYRDRLKLTFILSVCFELLRDIAKAAFLENQKRAYFTSIGRGLVDAYKKRLGK
ncbi:glycosyltransferase [Nostoc sp. CHAB 5834]|nr:glycosyltransferase [Nostoc sp. CHAB 5834]